MDQYLVPIIVLKERGYNPTLQMKELLREVN